MTTTNLVKALRICSRRTDVKGCGSCLLTGLAADLIEWLISANANLHEEIDRKNEVQALYHKKLETLEAERDALLTLAKNANECSECKNCNSCERLGEVEGLCGLCGSATKCPCYGCRGERWEWRGLPEAPEEGASSV